MTTAVGDDLTIDEIQTQIKDLKKKLVEYEKEQDNWYGTPGHWGRKDIISLSIFLVGIFISGLLALIFSHGWQPILFFGGMLSFLISVGFTSATSDRYPYYGIIYDLERSRKDLIEKTLGVKIKQGTPSLDCWTKMILEYDEGFRTQYVNVVENSETDLEEARVKSILD